MKSQLLQINRSKTRIDSCSPYLDHIVRNKHNKSTTELKSLPAATIKTTVAENFAETEKYKKFKRHLTLSYDRNSIETNKAKQLEELFHERMEKFHSGETEWLNEIEIIDSIYYEIFSHFSCFDNLLKTLKNKMKECLKIMTFEHYKEKIEKLKQKNQVLVVKINNLTKINQDLSKENEHVRKSQENFERLFKDNPEILVNYENIVDKMLKQCQVIDNLKKEIKRLRKIQITNNQIISELKFKSNIKDDSF
ncbi:hypothetical protein SteCoe_6563 [Stentor coeruleus]|uniref:Uncharacterized protein n=1 Tax=Stentor coeruleus TaxID=5963 RepID=A0A1R2CPS2_9CILI|nr:hypothetical protein SteCoe_6563 [Stentor coeruleus]